RRPKYGLVGENRAVYRPRKRSGCSLSEPNCEPLPVSSRTDSSEGFQATRRPVGVGSGISMGVSGTSGGGLLGWAGAGRATAAARRKAGVERTDGRYSAVSMYAGGGYR